MKVAALDRAAVFARQGGRCAGLGINPTCTGVAVDPHELVPVGAGGKRISQNRVGLCRACHRETQGRVGGLRLRFFWGWSAPNADRVGNVLPWWDATAGKDGSLLISVFYLQRDGDGQAQGFTCLKAGYLLKPVVGSEPKALGLVSLDSWEPFARMAVSTFLGFQPIPELVTLLAQLFEQRLQRLDLARAALVTESASTGTVLAFLRSDVLEGMLEQIGLDTAVAGKCWRCGGTGISQEDRPCSCTVGRLRAEQEGAVKRG
jgi:hypothetical protein